MFWANIPEFLIRPFNDCLGVSGLRRVHRRGQESQRGGGGRRKNLSVCRIIKTLWWIIKTHFFPFPPNGKQGQRLQHLRLSSAARSAPEEVFEVLEGGTWLPDGHLELP